MRVLRLRSRLPIIEAHQEETFWAAREHVAEAQRLLAEASRLIGVAFRILRSRRKADLNIRLSVDVEGYDLLVYKGLKIKTEVLAYFADSAANAGTFYQYVRKNGTDVTIRTLPRGSKVVEQANA